MLSLQGKSKPNAELVLSSASLISENGFLVLKKNLLSHTVKWIFLQVPSH